MNLDHIGMYPPGTFASAEWSEGTAVGAQIQVVFRRKSPTMGGGDLWRKIFFLKSARPWFVGHYPQNRFEISLSLSFTRALLSTSKHQVIRWLCNGFAIDLAFHSRSNFESPEISSGAASRKPCHGVAPFRVWCDVLFHHV